MTMVERRVCTFCGDDIEPGTGKMYAKRDGTVYHFCTMKCQKNMLKLKRVPRRVRWTKNYEKAPAAKLLKRKVRRTAEAKKKPVVKKKAEPEA